MAIKSDRATLVDVACRVGRTTPTDVAKPHLKAKSGIAAFVDAAKPRLGYAAFVDAAKPRLGTHVTALSIHDSF